MEIVLLHFSKQSRIINMTVRLSQTSIIYRQVGVVAVQVPSIISSHVGQKQNEGSHRGKGLWQILQHRGPWRIPRLAKPRHVKWLHLRDDKDPRVLRPTADENRTIRPTFRMCGEYDLSRGSRIETHPTRGGSYCR